VILPVPALLTTDALTADAAIGETEYGTLQPTWLLKLHLVDRLSAAPFNSEPASVIAPVLLDEPGLVTTCGQLVAPAMSNALFCEMILAL